MRIHVISSELPPGPGGIGTHAYEVARGLVCLGHEVEVVAAQDYVEAGEASAWNAAQPFAVVPLARAGSGGRLGRAWSRLKMLRRRLVDFRPDVILASGDPAVYWTRLALKTVRRRPSVVAVEHGRVPPAREARLKRWSFEGADHVVAVSAYSLGRLQAWGVRPRAESVIHNGADVDFFRPVTGAESADLRRELGLGDVRLLLTVGSVHARKGQDLVVRALPSILQAVPDVHYLVAGLGHEAAALEDLARAEGVADRIHLLGAVDRERLRVLYGTCDLFLMTSRNTETQFEGFGIAAIEAALCGRPALVTGGSGLHEAVLDGETGRVAAPEDPQDVARLAIELLSSPGDLRALGEAARRRAMEELSWQASATAYGELLVSLADGGRR